MLVGDTSVYEKKNISEGTVMCPLTVEDVGEGTISASVLATMWTKPLPVHKALLAQLPPKHHPLKAAFPPVACMLARRLPSYSRQRWCS